MEKISDLEPVLSTQENTDASGSSQTNHFLSKRDFESALLQEPSSEKGFSSPQAASDDEKISEFGTYSQNDEPQITSPSFKRKTRKLPNGTEEVMRRKRRQANEITRKFECPVQMCHKSYG
jgi:hypothetical protein